MTELIQRCLIDTAALSLGGRAKLRATGQVQNYFAHTVKTYWGIIGCIPTFLVGIYVVIKSAVLSGKQSNFALGQAVA